MSKCVRVEVRSSRSTRGARAMSTTSPGASGTPNWPSNVTTMSDCGADRGLQRDVRAVAGSTSGRLRERVRRDRRQHERVDRRMHDRAARREVVGGRSGGRRDDQAVGFDVTDELAVDVDVDLDHARQRAARDDDVVERERARRSSPSPRGRGPSSISRVSIGRPAGEERLERARSDRLRPTSVRKPSRPRLMPRSGASPLECATALRRVEQRAVAAEGDHDVDVRRRATSRATVGQRSPTSGRLRRCLLR